MACRYLRLVRHKVKVRERRRGFVLLTISRQRELAVYLPEYSTFRNLRSEIEHKRQCRVHENLMISPTILLISKNVNFKRPPHFSLNPLTSLFKPKYIHYYYFITSLYCCVLLLHSISSKWLRLSAEMWDESSRLEGINFIFDFTLGRRANQC